MKKSPIREPYPYIKAKQSNTGYPDYPDMLANYRWDHPKASDDLEIFTVEPVSVSTQGDCYVDDGITVSGDSLITVDFGSEFAGWLEVDIPGFDGEITLAISEYNEPAIVNRGPKSPSKTADPVRYGDSFRLELNDELYEGVRFGFIHISSVTKPVKIEQIRLVCQTKPVNYNGSFHCDNEMLNQIWYTGAYCVRVNLRKDYFSAILMDRGDRYSWTGDAYPAQDAALSAFGNVDFIYQNLVYTASRGNGIPSYELYWLLSLVNYYRYTGDIEGVRALREQIVSRLNDAIFNFDKEIKLVFFGHDERLGAAFEHANMPANHKSYRFLTVQALEACLACFRELLPGELSETAVRLRESCDTANLTLHSAADAINAGLLTEKQSAQYYERFFTDRVNRLSYSPFNEYFLLQALAKMNRHTDAIDSILDFYGGQIEFGGTGFFEVFRPCWNAIIGRHGAPVNCQCGLVSLNHPWGSGVVHFLSEEILGIRPIEPGFRTFEIVPHTGGRLDLISGSTPSPFGTIAAIFDRAGGLCKVSVPKGTTGRVSIPKFGYNASVDTEVAGEDGDYLHLPPLPAGDYTFQVHYSGERQQVPTQKAYTYSLKGPDEPRTNYGADGYFINDGDMVLPDYVSSVTLNKAVQKENGALYTCDDKACFQTFTVDVALNKPATVTLRFEDTEPLGRRQALELFDLATLELLSPVQMIQDFAHGKTLSYTYDKPIRFRVNQVRGLNAVLNGIYFDRV